MADLDLGKVGFIYKGDWSALDSGYEYLDSLKYLGAMYVVILREGTVPVGTLPTNTTYFKKAVDKGDTGATGATGSIGPTGTASILPWTATAYTTVNSQVTYLGKIWANSSATTSSDIPGTASVWVEVLTGYDVNNYTQVRVAKLRIGYVDLVTSPVNDTLVGTAYKSGKEEVIPGDVWHVKGKGGITPRLWAWVKADGTIISRATANLDSSSAYLNLTAPTDAKYLYFNFDNGFAGDAYRDSIVPQIRANSDKVDRALLTNKYTTADTVKGSYYPLNGSTVGALTSNGGYENIVLDVALNDVIIVKGAGGTSPRLWGLVDGSGNILRTASDASNNGYTQGRIVVTEGAATKLYVNNLLSSPEFYVYKSTYAVAKNINVLSHSRNVVYVAASDSDPIDKYAADVLCTGLNDEKAIEAAIDMLINGGKVYLFAGTYSIDNFTSRPDGSARAAIMCKDNGVNRFIEIIGVTRPQFFYGRKCAILKVSDAYWAVASDTTPITVLRGQDGALGHSAMKPTSCFITDIIITVPDNTKPVTLLDYRFFTTGGMSGVQGYPETVFQNIYNGTGRAPIPHTGSAGVVGFGPTNSGYYTTFSNTIMNGFHYGFSLGGDHLLLEKCAGTRNTYAFAFGMHSRTSHDLTLLKCVDETNSNFPLFGDNTGIDGFIHIDDFTIERQAGRAPVDGSPYAVELTPGRWSGKIEVSRLNGEDNLFFAAGATGSGKRIRTWNKSHAKGGPTSLRNTYAPSLFQEYFDTDLHKPVTYDGANWRDSSGTIV